MAEGNISRLLKDMEHGDQDNREMAATDMCTEITKGVKLDTGLEESICKAYVKQLADSSVGVRGNAVKCISRICNKIQEVHFGFIANKLTECVVKESEEFRDIYATCLKTLISEADLSFGKTLCSALLDPLIAGTGHKNDAVKETCIEITNDLLKRFNSVIVHNPALMKRDLLMNNLINQLNSSKDSLRKKACSCFGSLAVTLTPKQLSELISLIMKNINPKNILGSYPFIESLGAIVSTVGYKLAPNIPAIMEALGPFIAKKDQSELKNPEIDHGIKEICLTIYDFSVRKCPKESSDYLDEMLENAINLIGYDPNFNVDAVMSESQIEDFGDWGEPAEQPMVMEDDLSWKVRKAAAKLLATIIRYRNDKVKPMYERVVNILIGRLHERDETIKCEIINIFTDMIKSTVVEYNKREEESEFPQLLHQKSSYKDLYEYLPGAIDNIQKHLSDKSLAVKEAIVDLLHSMSIAVPKLMNEKLIGSVLPKILEVYKESSSSVKIILLQTLRRLIRTSGNDSAYISFVKQIITVLQQACKENYYKLPTEAMNTAGSLVRLFRKNQEPPIPEATTAIKEIFTMCASIFKLSDIDPEIKQAVIYAIGNIVAFASDVLTDKQIDDILLTMQDRLKNEALRAQIMKSFHTIVASPKKLKIEARIESMIPDFLQMSHKIARPVKLAALDTFVAACEKYPEICQKSASLIIKETTPLLKENDLQILQKSLKIICYLTSAGNDESINYLLENMLETCRSPLIGSVIDETIAIMQAIASKGKGAMSPGAISEALIKDCNEKNIRSIAAIIARVVMLRDDEVTKMLEVYSKSLTDKSNPLKRKLSYMIIGNIGTKKDLSKYGPLNTLIDDQLKNAEEEMKINVAICLGNIALGNKGFYIPKVIEMLKSKSQISYLMLVALKEIVTLDSEGIMKSVAEIIPVLKAQADTDDEGYRSIIAEVIGKLLYADPYTLISELSNGIEDSKPNVRATYALSFKYWYGRGKHDLAMFNDSMPKLLKLFNDTDVKVQKALLDSLTHVAYNNAIHLRANATMIFEGAIELTKYRKELVTIINLGPLEHKVDKGEPVRKGAYILLNYMLNQLNDKMELPKLADKVIIGLVDESDEVQNSCQQIVIKLCEISPGTILGPLDKLLEQTTISIQKLQTKLAKKQDIDRTADNLRGFLRILIAMNKLPEIDLNQRFQEFKKNLLNDAIVKNIYEELSKLGE